MWQKTRMRRREHKHTVNFKTTLLLTFILLQVKRFLVFYFTLLPILNYLFKMCSCPHSPLSSSPLYWMSYLPLFSIVFPLQISNFTLPLFYFLQCFQTTQHQSTYEHQSWPNSMSFLSPKQKNVCSTWSPLTMALVFWNWLFRNITIWIRLSI